MYVHLPSAATVTVPFTGSVAFVYASVSPSMSVPTTAPDTAVSSGVVTL